MATAEAALSRAHVDRADAERVIDAYGALTAARGDAKLHSTP